MTEVERKRYKGILVENLYSKLKIISEGTISEDSKREIAAKMVYDFYKEYKEKYGIESIEEVMKELDIVDKNVKESHGIQELDEK